RIAFRLHVVRTAPPKSISLLLCGCRAWWRAAFYFGGDGSGAGAVFSYGADGEEVVVGGDAFQDGFAWGRREFVDLPAGLAGFAPENFEAGALGLFLGGPGYFRVGRYRAGELGVRRRGGRESQLAQRFRVVARDIAH